MPELPRHDIQRSDDLGVSPSVHSGSGTVVEVEVEPQPSLADWVDERPALRWAVIGALVLIALVSVFALRPHFEKPETWSSTVSVLDQKKSNVLGLTATSVALSAGISAIPGDTGTPIAEQLSQLASNLGIVLAMLYLEKYLLTILSFLSFGILIPLSCALFAIAVGMHNRLSTSRMVRILGTRILVVALIALAVVPASVWVTERIDETYEVSVAQATDSTEDTKTQADSSDDSDKSSGNLIDDLINAATDLGNTVASGLQSVTDDVIAQVNSIIEGAVVMIVTSCVIPILVLLVFMWLGHVLLGIDISAPAGALMRRVKRPLHKPTLNRASSSNGTLSK